MGTGVGGGGLDGPWREGVACARKEAAGEHSAGGGEQGPAINPYHQYGSTAVLRYTQAAHTHAP